MNHTAWRGVAALTFGLAFAVSPAWAAGKVKLSQAQVDYQHQRERCLRGETSQPRATCLNEAAAAYDEARRGQLGNPSGADMSRNATQRCDAQPPADRDACVQRVLGAGKVEGSVQGGGVIRATETPVK